MRTLRAAQEVNQTAGVTVTATLTAERSLLIRVSDTGVGMLLENLARIFDEYGQFGNAERDGNKGWGSAWQSAGV